MKIQSGKGSQSSSTRIHTQQQSLTFYGLWRFSSYCTIGQSSMMNYEVNTSAHINDIFRCTMESDFRPMTYSLSVERGWILLYIIFSSHFSRESFSLHIAFPSSSPSRLSLTNVFDRVRSLFHSWSISISENTFVALGCLPMRHPVRQCNVLKCCGV